MRDGDLVLDLPYPPSVNHYWRSVGKRVLISKEGRQYRENVGFSLLNAGYRRGLSMSGRLAVNIALHPPDRRRRDLDNVLKSLLDAMQHAGVYEDDSQIDRISIERCGVLAGGLARVEVCARHGGAEC